MKHFAEKLRQVEKNLAAKRGDFYLFALWQREAARLWDLVSVADWAGRLPIIRAIGSVVDEIRSSLGESALLRFSRVFTFPVKTPGLSEIYRHFPAERSLVEMADETFLGLDIREGYILTARAKLLKKNGKVAVS